MLKQNTSAQSICAPFLGFVISKLFRYQIACLECYNFVVVLVIIISFSFFFYLCYATKGMIFLPHDYRSYHFSIKSFYFNLLHLFIKGFTLSVSVSFCLFSVSFSFFLYFFLICIKQINYFLRPLMTSEPVTAKALETDMRIKQQQKKKLNLFLLFSVRQCH